MDTIEWFALRFRLCIIGAIFRQEKQRTDPAAMTEYALLEENGMEDKKRVNSGLPRKNKFTLIHWQQVAVFLIIYDLLVVTGSYFLALWLRFDCRFSEIPLHYLWAWLKFSPVYAAVSVFAFWKLRLYQSVWKYVSYVELERIATASAILTVFHTVFITVLFQRMPITYYAIGAIIQFLLTTLSRFAYRFLTLERRKELKDATRSRVMLIGAGEAGQMLLRDLNTADDSDGRVCCIVDDDKNKWGRFIDGVPIVGGRDDIFLNVEKYKIEKIYFAVPSIDAEERRDILNICKETKCELKILPSAFRFASSNVSAKSAVIDVDVEDLLGREAIKTDMGEIYSFIAGKVILVTGGGGSIGSELCRQIAQHNPKQLIIFDIYENNAHAIGLELKDNYPDLNLVVLIGSVRDSRRINQVFKKYRPEVVYHAAAHKHVPLMEDSPCESIKNNAIGTYKTAYAAMMNGCKRFVLISTDKAVNPTNIMGASKRLCEMIIQTFDRKIKEGKAQELNCLRVHPEEADGDTPNVRMPETVTTEFVAVRFGNVLGSNGSVIPRFKSQIAKGGPVTVTHPDIIRYFMTIPEAASLVLQAGTYANGGEIFVLDMGMPVRIDTLARNLIRLSGLQPDVDIQISYTGLRAGEKMYEEKLMEEEGMRTTPNHLIHIGCPISFDTDSFLQQLQMLMNAAYSGQEDQIRELVSGIVPTYHPME